MRKKKMVVTITIILAVIFVLSIVGGFLLVNHFKNKEDIVYMTNEEFFTYYTQEMGLETKLYTEEEFANADIQMIMAVLVENGCLTQDETNIDLTAPVTKETVVLICARGSDHLPTGDVKDIKNSKDLKEPQLIADAYKANFFELKWGKFDYDTNMTVDEAKAVVTVAQNYNKLFVLFDDNTVVIPEEDGAKGDNALWFN